MRCQDCYPQLHARMQCTTSKTRTSRLARTTAQSPRSPAQPLCTTRTDLRSLPNHIRSFIHEHAIPLPLAFLLYSRHCPFQLLRGGWSIHSGIHGLFHHLVALLLGYTGCHPWHIECASALRAQSFDHGDCEVGADNDCLWLLTVILRAYVERRRLFWAFPCQEQGQLSCSCFGCGQEVYDCFMSDWAVESIFRHV